MSRGWSSDPLQGVGNGRYNITNRRNVASICQGGMEVTWVYLPIDPWLPICKLKSSNTGIYHLVSFLITNSGVKHEHFRLSKVGEDRHAAAAPSLC